MRLENDELAIKNLNRLLEQEEIEGQDLADVTSTLAQAYINLKVLDTALMQIKIAAETTKKNFEKGRYNFIKGQLYNKLQDKDSANLAFDEVIDLNRKIPRKYLINAYLEKAKNFDYETGDKLAFSELLTRMEEERENRPFLDKIYHQIGQYHLTNANDSLATAYYNKSLRTNSSDKILVARNYEILGDMNFDKNNYKIAGAYFDSTMTKMVKDSKPFRVLKRKRENLDDVIYYENIAETNDSILNLVAMPKADRLNYFKDYVSDLKAKAEAEKERLAIEAQKAGLATNNAGNTNDFIKPAGGSPGASTFYFYNDQTVAYGKNEFIRIWGERELKDNWRWSSNRKAVAITSSQSTDGEEVSENELFDVKYYLDKIPKEETEIADLVKERNYAYYQLGLIYKEKFKEYESRYASILSNPELALEKDANSAESIYESVYKLFEEQKFTEVIIETTKHITAFEGDEMVPKFELLKAFAAGRLYGFDEYKKAINNVAIAYANTAEGVQAQNILDKSLKNIENPEFIDDTASTNCKVVYSFINATATELTNYKKELDRAIDKMKYQNMYTSIDLYNPQTKFVVVHGLRSIESSKGFVDLFTPAEKAKISRPFFGISSDNYRILQIHKNLESYKTNQ